MARPLNEVKLSLELHSAHTQIDVEKLVCDILNTDKWEGHIANINYLHPSELGRYQRDSEPLATYVDVLVSLRP